MSKSSRGKEKKGTAKRPSRLQRFWDQLRPGLSRYVVIAAFTVGLFLLLRPQVYEDFSGFRLGEPAPRSVKAPVSFDYVDHAATQKLRGEAMANTPPSYLSRPGVLDGMTERIMELGRQAALIEPGGRSPRDWGREAAAAAGVDLESRSAGDGAPADLWNALLEFRNQPAYWDWLADAARSAAGAGIADDIAPLRESGGATGAHLVDENGAERILPSSRAIVSESGFFERAEERLASAAARWDDPAAAVRLGMAVLRASHSGPALEFLPGLTAERKSAAAERVKPVMGEVEKDQTIVGRRELVTLGDMQVLQALRDRAGVPPAAEAGYFILAVIYMFMLLRFQKAYYPAIANDTRKYSVIFAAILLMVGLAQVIFYISRLDIGDHKLAEAGFGVPMGALGVLLTVLAGVRMAMFVCALTSVYAGFILGGAAEPFQLQYAAVAMLTAWGAIHTVSKIRQRSDLYRAGGVVVILAGILILALSLKEYRSVDSLVAHAEAMKWSLIWGMINGMMVSVLSIALLPIFEDMIGITTDIKLLELTQKNELLQRLEQEAPGTYQHSMRVATLAETAAEAIGANALLTRVGCYYHDIGKMEKPQYFVENQQTSADRAKHSKLSPNMSCLIIRNHVKNGIEMARKYKLPKPISDFIPEHHGTTLMTYFYHEALTNQESEGRVKEEDFRYPGPKPQTRETAIVMLSDSLEAASRTLENSSEREVRQLVRKIINDRFMDQQFDECNLTMRDLNKLYHSFSDSIMHMMHQRITYPTLAPRPRQGEGPEAEPVPAPAVKSRSEGARKPAAPKEKEAPVAIKPR